jgi:hypothetical protein
MKKYNIKRNQDAIFYYNGRPKSGKYVWFRR